MTGPGVYKGVRTAATWIKKVLEVTDTRTWEEGPDERWYPTPGSGVQNECGRCGRTHEVLWRVELSDGTETVVGASCAKAAGMDAKRVNSVESTVKTLARLRAELPRAEKKLAARVELEARAAALTPPTVVFGNEPDGRKWAAVGDCRGGIYEGVPLTPDREQALESGWRANRIAEWTDGTLGRPAYMLREDVERLKADIRKTEERLRDKVNPGTKI